MGIKHHKLIIYFNFFCNRNFFLDSIFLRKHGKEWRKTDKMGDKIECQMRYGFCLIQKATYSIFLWAHNCTHASIVHNFTMSTFSIVPTSISDFIIILHRASQIVQQQRNDSHLAIYNTFFIKLNNIMEKIIRGNGSKIRMNEWSISGSTLVVCFVTQPFNLM